MPVGSLAQFLTVLLIFLLVLFLAWYSARIVARYQKGAASSQGNIEVVDAYRLSQSQVIELLKIGDRYVAVALCKDGVTRLGEWKEGEIELKFTEKTAAQPAGSFRQLLDRFGKNKEADDTDQTKDRT